MAKIGEEQRALRALKRQRTSCLTAGRHRPSASARRIETAPRRHETPSGSLRDGVS